MNTHPLRNTLRNNSNTLDLRHLQQLHSTAIDTPRTSEVDNGIDIRVLRHSLAHILVDGQQRLLGAPVHLTDELAAEGVDDARDGGHGSLADEVEVEHALDGAGLHAVDETSGFVVEEVVPLGG